MTDLSTKLVIGGELRDAADGRTFATFDPAHGGELASVAQGGTDDVDAAVAAARGALEGAWAKTSPRQAGPRAESAGAAAGRADRCARRAREPEQREGEVAVRRRDQGRGRDARALRRHRAASVRALARREPRGRDVHAPRAGRRGRGDHPVELPADDGGLEGRAGAGGREHARPEARIRHPADRDPARRARPRGGHPARRAQRRPGPGRRGGGGDRGSSRHRQGRLHRRDGDRPANRGSGREDAQARLARARREEPEPRLRRCGPRRGGHRLAVGDLLLRRPVVRGALTDPRAGRGL